MIWLYWLLLVRWVWKLYNFFTTLSLKSIDSWRVYLCFLSIWSFVSCRANFLSFRFTFWFKEPKIIFLSLIWNGNWLSIYFCTTLIRWTYTRMYSTPENEIFILIETKKIVVSLIVVCVACSNPLNLNVIESFGREKFRLLSFDVDLWPQTSMALILFRHKSFSKLDYFPSADENIKSCCKFDCISTRSPNKLETNSFMVQSPTYSVR